MNDDLREQLANATTARTPVSSPKNDALVYGAIEGGGTKFVCEVGRSATDVYVKCRGANLRSGRHLRGVRQLLYRCRRQIRADWRYWVRMLWAARSAQGLFYIWPLAGDAQAQLVSREFACATALALWLSGGWAQDAILDRSSGRYGQRAGGL